MQIWSRKKSMGNGVVQEDRLQEALDFACRRLGSLHASMARSVSPATARSEAKPASITSEVRAELNQDLKNIKEPIPISQKYDKLAGTEAPLPSAKSYIQNQVAKALKNAILITKPTTII